MKRHAAGEHLLPAVAYGDAAGLPHEKKPPLRPGSLDRLEDTRTNPYLGEYPAGTWSDDTHLSLAVALSLIEADGFDLASMARWHVAAYAHVKGASSNPDLVPPIVTVNKNNGWGGSTTQSIERLMRGVEPSASGQEEGAGNGVLMKLAPLVYWQEARSTPLDTAEQQTIALTRMTHAAPEAVVSSLVHRNVLSRLLAMEDGSSSSSAPREILLKAHADALGYERRLDAEPVTSRILRPLTDALEHGPLTREVILAAAPKAGFHAPETLVMAYGAFLLENRFPESVFRAVELGGDSDSIGSIVATMSTFLHGEVKFPSDYEKVFARERLERLSRRFAAAAR
ncbi:ADP-ribosylglycohydrolase family protein [Archangium violaceum]|uniref:ADP-ribosylglycohydrolase family protein n=1 Tax=Archangium violaceum TaxID=83451 RepID=UPI00194E89E9|nr:ADP-ribosylglycohydrolase family protein [Archangium violaceum]QRO02306.1 ADP-ribosylglycohydrolase family protein [Archangium violaceum]